jgi:serine protease Do
MKRIRMFFKPLLPLIVLLAAIFGLGGLFGLEAHAHRAPRAQAQTNGPILPAQTAAPGHQDAPTHAGPPPVSPGNGPALEGARALSTAFTRVAAALKPAVVRITTAKTMKQNGRQGRHLQFQIPFGSPFGGNDEDNPFRFWFGEPGDSGDSGPEQESQRVSGLGSGVIIDPHGYILTNNHVVDGADEIRVQLADGEHFTARLVGADPKTDLALIEVRGTHSLPYAMLGNSDNLEVGEMVVAIGNPYGLDETVTVGVVSAKGRDALQGGPAYEDFIQTDARINPGNSGGPLVNLNGEVIGINSAIRVANFGHTGIGFAIPSNMARNVADQLRHGGRVRRPWLGVNIQNVTPDLARGLGAGAPTAGALIAQVQPGSPAEHAGLKAGDVVRSVNGHAVASGKDLQRLVLESRIGERVQLQVWRDGRWVNEAVTTREMPGEPPGAKPNGAPRAPAAYGLEFRDLTPGLAQQLNLKARHGAVITRVTPGGEAEAAGLRSGDVVLEVNRRHVSNASDLARALDGHRGPGHLLRVQRGDAALFVMLGK